MASRSRKNMRSRRNKNSRRNRRASRSRQRGGVVLAPAAYNSPSVLLPGGVGSLVQGAQFAQQHLGQHGGAAPIGTTGVLPSGMTDAAMQGKLLSALNEIKNMSDMTGGRRRRSRKARKGTKKASRKGRKGSKKASRKSKRKASLKSRKSLKSRRRQRGGQAPANASYMLGVEAKGAHPQFNDFNQL